MIILFLKYLALIPIYLPGRDVNVFRRSSTTNVITGTSTSTSTTNIILAEDRFYVFDFLNANSGISMGGGGRTVAATVKSHYCFVIDEYIS